MMRGIRKTGERAAFTLIEMLVAMALTVFVMVILSEAFVKGLTTFSGLKAIGDMQENLRVATNNLRGDLAQDHFDGKRRTSDPHFWTDRPRNGFVGIYQGASINEGTVEGITSYRATNHILHLTVKRKGNRLEDFFSASVAGTPLANPAMQTDIFKSAPDAVLRSDPNTFKSQWAEVAYFLIRTGTTVDVNDETTAAGVVPIYNLYRLELAIVPDNTAVTGVSVGSRAALKHMACLVQGANLYFPSPGDYTTQFPGGGLPPVPPKRAFDRTVLTRAKTDPGLKFLIDRASLVMSDVVSFQVQALFHVPPQEATLSDGRRTMLGNFDVPGGLKDIAGGVFDTAAVTAYKETFVYHANAGVTATVDATLKGVSITIRGWDRANSQARQTTIILDL